MPNLTFRYIIALVIIVPFIGISYFLLYEGLEKQLSDSRVINVAGRQRMLSQKISKAALEVLAAKNDWEINSHGKELEESLAIWEKSHGGLQKGDGDIGLPGENSYIIKNLFNEIEPSYRIIAEETEDIIKEIKNGGKNKNTGNSVSIILSNETAFLSGMDKIVFQYDKEARDRVEKLRQMEFILLWTTFAILAINGIFILRPAVKRLKSADKLKDEFISIASHQLRTPLTGIKWAAEQIMKKERLSDGGKEYMSHIIMSVKNLSSLVNTLLNLSRLSAGKITAQTELVELGRFFNDLIDEHRPICDKKKINVIFSCQQKILEAKTDKNALRDIAQALFSNAIEYTPDGGKIEISLKKNFPKFIFSIKDNGIGIPKEEQKMFLFQKFHRSSSAKKIKPEGLGLGLYIAKQAADILRGKIWFESEEDKGSVFYVELPLESS